MKPKNELSSLHLSTLIALHRLVPDFFLPIFSNMVQGRHGWQGLQGLGHFRDFLSTGLLSNYKVSECSELDLRNFSRQFTKSS